MSTSHPRGKRTKKRQGVGAVSWRECSQGISGCCKPHSSQAKACPKRLCNLPIQAFPWCKCGQYSEMPVLWWLPSKSGWIQTPLETQGSAPKTSLLNPRIQNKNIQNGKKFALKSTSNYYFQVQLQMFVRGLTLCIFVVWTNKRIFTVEVPYDPSFMSVVCAKLEKFWTSQVLPFLISEVFTTSLPGKYL